MKRFWQKSWLAEKEDDDGLLEFRQAGVIEISILLSVIGWLAGVRAIIQYNSTNSLVAAGLLLAGAAAAVRLRHNNSHLALYLLILSLVGANALEQHFFPDGPARYLYPIAVVLSSMLVSNLGVLFISALAAFSCTAVAHLQGVDWLDSGQVVTPVLLLFATTLASRIGSRQLHTAFSWVQTSYKQTRSLLEQLREERAALARTIKALEEAHVRLEKTNYELIEARSIAEEARRLKSSFVANISHELRTPLNLIIGFSETMANAPEVYGRMAWPPSLRGDVEHIYRASRHLLSLINDILDLSALEVHKLGIAMQEVDPENLINEAVQVIGELYRAKKLYLKVEVEPGLPLLRVDPVRIRQVLLNLLSNASRFTYTGGVTIKARLELGAFQISVADTGIGIAAEDIPKLFEEFQQIDSTISRKHEGTGLGIAISKRLVELHGGQMWVESAPNLGTTFYFTLPLTNAGLRAISENSNGAQHDRELRLPYRRCILVIEPDPLLLLALRRHIEGYDLVEVKAPDQLAGMINNYRPVALFIDNQISGLQAAAAGWKNSIPQDMPVYEVTLEGPLAEFRGHGIQGYITKPVERKLLLETIAALGTEIQDILIVDNEPEMAEMLSRLLQTDQSNYLTVKAFGGEDALQKIHRQPPDLVLLDMMMPGMSGLELLQAIRSDEKTTRLPVIMVSGLDPDLQQPKGGVGFHITRINGFSVSEVFDFVKATLNLLPLRDLPASIPPQASPEDPDG